MSTLKEQLTLALASINGLTAYSLANISDTQGPDSLESAGADFLTRVRNGVVERLEWDADNGKATLDDYDELSQFIEGFRDGDAPAEIADNAPSVYTHERFKQLVDLCAYQEDVSELAGDETDMEKLAGIALYIVAERLVNALLDYVADFEADTVEVDFSKGDAKA